MTEDRYSDVVAAAAGDSDSEPLTALGNAVTVARDLVVHGVARYTRLTVDLPDTLPDQPTMFVANHGFGGIFDLNVAAILSALDRLTLDRPVTVLAHQLAWTLGIGPLLESIGVRRASWPAGGQALASGRHVLVLPGGDVEAGKPFRRRHDIVFDNRSGFARLAQTYRAPVVPVVTRGAGNSLLVLHDGRGLARLLRVDRTLRMKALPVSVSIPWGLNVGVVGLLPYLPLPVRLRTAVLEPMRVDDDEPPAVFADRVRETMQHAMDDLARGPHVSRDR